MSEMDSSMVGSNEASQRYITLRSSDGEDFRVYRNDLESCSEGFIGPPSCENSEVVWLTESTDVLRLLLQFMGQDSKVPNLKTLPFAKLAELSEAVEKYQVHKAIDICESHMCENASAHPIEVLTYALKHDHRITADAAARATIRMEVSDVLNTLPPEYHVHWLRYRQGWYQLCHQILQYKSPTACRKFQAQPRRKAAFSFSLFSSVSSTSSAEPVPKQITCRIWPAFYAFIASAVTRGGDSLQDISEMFHVAGTATHIHYCDACGSFAQDWEKYAKRTTDNYKLSSNM